MTKIERADGLFEQGSSSTTVPIVKQYRPASPSDELHRKAKFLFDSEFGYKAVAHMLNLSANTVKD